MEADVRRSFRWGYLPIKDFLDALDGYFVEMSYKISVLVKLYDISTGTIHFYRIKVI